MLQHVWERALECRSLDKIIIATDDEKILSVARGFGAEVQLTSPNHRSGTDRVAEVASGLAHPIIVNIQGDEPLIDPAAIDIAVQGLCDHPDALMGTLRRPIDRLEEITNPNCVKVVTDHDGYAIYFSRSAIPFNRGGVVTYYQHIGLYVYRRDFLLEYSSFPVGPLEMAERLEQLRALENGFRIFVATTQYESLGVDTPEDLQRVQALLARK